MKTQTVNRNTVLFLLYFFILCIIMGLSRLYYLQIRCKDQLKLCSEHNFIRLEKVQTPRGNIVDCNGHILATNKPIMHLFWQGTGKRSLTKTQTNLVKQLETILEAPFDEEMLKKIMHAEQFEKQLLLMPNISFEKLSIVAEQLGHQPNILIKNSFKRHYPYDQLASHVIGYLSYQDDSDGKMGLEKLYHNLLKGEPAIRKKTVNAIGKALYEEEFKAGITGKTLHTTLDFQLQQFGEKFFPQDWAGCMIVIDPQTGAIRVLISRPSFDPTIFLQSISHEQWEKLQENRPFLNRACEACYPPASLFKLVTVAAALEKGIVSKKTKCHCKGYITYGGRRYHCNSHTGHGKINFKESIAQSCNIIFYEIGKRISIDTLADYAHKLGLGRPTGINFPEKTGLVPSSQWKLREKGERWWQGETVSASIGQTYLLTTPLQIARMQSAICSGHLIKPRLLEEESIEKEAIMIKPETLKFLRKSMRATVEHGTGKRVREIEDLTIYAKTGTAQISSLKNRMMNSEELREHAWFVGTFFYKEEAPLVIVVLVEHAGGSLAPTTIAKKFLINYRNHMRQTYKQQTKSFTLLKKVEDSFSPDHNHHTQYPQFPLNEHFQYSQQDHQ